MATYIFEISTFLILYTWIGYYVVLRCLVTVLSNRQVTYDNNFTPFVSILISAYNEAEIIEKRIHNLLSLNYPGELIEIIIGSDGSTDNTVEIVKKYSDRGVKVAVFKKNRGRADIHNDLVKMAKGQVLVFTDADTIFETAFLVNICKPFSNQKIGAVVGRLFYNVKGGNIAEHESFYWKYEIRLKELENNLGIINNGTGACMAIRKELFKPLAPVDDVDTATIIDIILQGFKVVYTSDATASDIPPHSAKSEFKMRVRGTSKTLSSLRLRTNIIGWLKHPILLWGIISHRLGRFFTPYFMLVSLVANALILKEGTFCQITFMVQILFYSLVIAGWLWNRLGKEMFIASSCFCFFIAMAGMLVGVAKAITGRVTVTYKTDDGFNITLG